MNPIHVLHNIYEEYKSCIMYLLNLCLNQIIYLALNYFLIYLGIKEIFVIITFFE